MCIRFFSYFFKISTFDIWLTHTATNFGTCIQVWYQWSRLNRLLTDQLWNTNPTLVRWNIGGCNNGRNAELDGNTKSIWGWWQEDRLSIKVQCNGMVKFNHYVIGTKIMVCITVLRFISFSYLVTFIVTLHVLISNI